MNVRTMLRITRFGVAIMTIGLSGLSVMRAESAYKLADGAVRPSKLHGAKEAYLPMIVTVVTPPIFWFCPAETCCWFTMRAFTNAGPANPSLCRVCPGDLTGGPSRWWFRITKTGLIRTRCCFSLQTRRSGSFIPRSEEATIRRRIWSMP